MLKISTIEEYLNMPKKPLLLDVRSEGEFNQGHIPGAISFPILNNEERKLVGTCYKQKGHNSAVLLGYELVGPKFTSYLAYAYSHFEDKELFIHCWRGGLRSRIMANLLSSAGFDVTIIAGGYKTFRNTALDFLHANFNLNVLGGLTGSGKTEVLGELAKAGFQVIDIEQLASHKGSAFGALGLPEQPTQEQFENNIFMHCLNFNWEMPVWVEDESRLIGRLQVPPGIYAGIRSGFVYFLDYSFEKRLDHIIQEYGVFETKTLIETTFKLKKRMGDLTNRLAIESLESGDIKTWATLVLKHYDKQYLFGFGKRSDNQSEKIDLVGEHLINYLHSISYTGSN